MLGEELVLARMFDTIEHGAELVRVGAGETVAERDITICRDTHETEPRATRICLAHSFVQLLERVAHVGETVAPAGERRLKEIGGKRLESAEQRLKSFVL